MWDQCETMSAHQTLRRVGRCESSHADLANLSDDVLCVMSNSGGIVHE